MWGTIEGKKIKEIKESFCLGEACLIFEYDKDTERTVAFKTAADLRKAQTVLNRNNKNFVVEVIGNELHIKTTENILILNVANETHALRLKEVIENIKK